MFLNALRVYKKEQQKRGKRYSPLGWSSFYLVTTLQADLGQIHTVCFKGTPKGRSYSCLGRELQKK